MIIYNVTIKANLDIFNDLDYWLKTEYLPVYKAKNDNKGIKLFRLLNVDDQDGITICLQFYFKDLSTYNLHIVGEDVSFKKEIKRKFENQYILFTSLLSEE